MSARDRAIAALGLAAAVAAGCGPGASTDAASATASPDPPAEATPVWQEPDPDPEIEAGRQVWLGTCIRCHAQGLAGAPPIGDRRAWARRIEQGLPTLQAHALEGYEGPAGGMMPARGGNEELADEQVISAVRFMVSRSGG